MASKFDRFTVNEELLARIREERKEKGVTKPKLAKSIQRTVFPSLWVVPNLKFFNH